MERDERRITLITYDKQREERSWNFSDHSTNRIVFIESFALLRSTVASPLVRSDSDVERIVLDRCSTESEYLSLLADLPHTFTGDILMTYLVHPGTAVHLGFTDNYEEAASDSHRPFRIPTVPAGRQIFAKMSYLLRF